MEPPRPVAGYTWAIEPSGSGHTIRALDAGGATVASGSLTYGELAPREHRATFEATVEPGHQRRGLGAALMAWAESTARGHFAAERSRGHTVTFRATADTPGESAVSLYRATSLELAVAEDQMERSLEPALRRDLPEGLCVLPWGPMTIPLFFHAYESAFRERPGFPGWDEARWCSTYTGLDIFAPDLSVVVMDGPEPAAFAVVGVEDDAGWIFQVGVRPGWRGKGIGEALLAHTMHAFERRGLQKAALDVATNNAHARALYHRLGFVSTHSWQSWQKVL